MACPYFFPNYRDAYQFSRRQQGPAKAGPYPHPGGRASPTPSRKGTHGVPLPPVIPKTGKWVKMPHFWAFWASIAANRPYNSLILKEIKKVSHLSHLSPLSHFDLLRWKEQVLGVRFQV